MATFQESMVGQGRIDALVLVVYAMTRYQKYPCGG